MTDNFDVSSDLPAPRDDEPASLRQDIVDELADHLACSLHRELHRTPDAHTAQRNVLNRFGNPAALARRLWRDALWEKIMSQRITTIMATIAAVAAVSICVLLWRSLEQSRQAQSALAVSTERLIEKLGTLTVAPPATGAAADSWFPLSFTLKDEQGQPVRGTAKVQTRGQTMGGISLNKEADEAGRVDFGQIPGGQYWVGVEIGTDPRFFWHDEGLLVGPGQPSSHEIVCPPIKPPPLAKLRPVLEGPDDLRSKPLVYVVSFRGRGSFSFAGHEWSLSVPNNEANVLFDSDGLFVGLVIRGMHEASPTRDGTVRKHLTLTHQSEPKIADWSGVSFIGVYRKPEGMEFGPAVTETEVLRSDDFHDFHPGGYEVSGGEFRTSDVGETDWRLESSSEVWDRIRERVKNLPDASATTEAAAPTEQQHTVKLRLVQDQPGRPPAAGVTISVPNNLLTWTQRIPARIASATDATVLQTDSDGRASFNLMQQKLSENAVLSLTVTTLREFAFVSIYAQPGDSTEKEIVVPVSPPVECSLAFDVQRPDELKDE